MSKGKIAVGTIFGAVVGFVAGVLSAPKSGKQTRTDINKAAHKTKDVVVDEVEHIKDSTQKHATDIKNNAETFVDTATTKVESAIEKLEGVINDITNRTENAVTDAKDDFEKKSRPTTKK